jgi:hypothetical protein
MEAEGGSVADPFIPDLPIDPEVFKYVGAEMVVESGVELLLHSLVTGVVRENRSIRGVFIENKSGRFAVLGKVFIDATGDGDVAARAGVPFEKGRTVDGALLPMTLVFRLGGANTEEIEGIWKSEMSRGMHQTRIRASMEDAYRRGTIPVFGGPWIKTYGHAREHDSGANHASSPIRKGQLIVNAVRISGDSTDARSLSSAEIEARRHVWSFVRFFKQNIPELADCYLSETATQVAPRESRRILADYQLNLEDVSEGRLAEDTVALGGHPVDIHSPEGNTDQSLIWLEKPYGIPYRCLTPEGMDNLYVAGRPISATHEAHASLRVMGTAMALGQAAGAAASLASSRNLSTRGVSVSELREILMCKDVVLS